MRGNEKHSISGVIATKPNAGLSPSFLKEPRETNLSMGNPIIDSAITALGRGDLITAPLNGPPTRPNAWVGNGGVTGRHKGNGLASGEGRPVDGSTILVAAKYDRSGFLTPSDRARRRASSILGQNRASLRGFCSRAWSSGCRWVCAQIREPPRAHVRTEPAAARHAECNRVSPWREGSTRLDAESDSNPTTVLRGPTETSKDPSARTKNDRTLMSSRSRSLRSGVRQASAKV